MTIPHVKPSRRELFGLAAALGVPPASPAEEPLPQPDLGNLHKIMEWAAREHAPDLSFLDDGWRSLEEWKRVARPYYRGLLRYSPKPRPLAAKLVTREPRDGFTIEQVRISATEAYDIQAWVLVPERGKGPFPGVVTIHCHGGNYVFGHEKIIGSAGEPEFITEYRDKAYGRPYAELLAKRGYVVVVIDGFYFGSRRLKVEDLEPAVAPPYMRERLEGLRRLKHGTKEWYGAVNGLCHEYENLTAKTMFSAGITWPGLLVWDDMRSVDYLASRPDVDPKRIGCLGLSIGGLRTAHLIAADPRIKAACVAGWMTEFGSQLRKHLRWHTWMIYIPGLYSALDLPDAAALHAPGALLVLQCLRDSLYPVAGMKGSVEKLGKIYAKAGIPDRFKGNFYDVPHSFTPVMQEEAFAWLDRWLK